MLVVVVHTVDEVSATLPLSMIVLLEHAKRKSVPPDMSIRHVSRVQRTRLRLEIVGFGSIAPPAGASLHSRARPDSDPQCLGLERYRKVRRRRTSVAVASPRAYVGLLTVRRAPSSVRRAGSPAGAAHVGHLQRERLGVR